MQMDVYSRLWNSAGRVQTSYIGSTFIGHAAAERMLEKFSECVWRLTLAKLVRISMDCPNWNLYKMIQSNMKTNLQIVGHWNMQFAYCP